MDSCSWPFQTSSLYALASSPTNAVIRYIVTPTIRNSYKIHNRLSVAYLLRNGPKVRVFISDYDSLSEIENGLYAADHKARNVWDTVENEISISSDQMQRSYPFPNRRSMTSIIGLSRKSSVPALKLKPRIPIFFCPFSMISCKPRLICASLLSRIEPRIGKSKSAVLAL